MRTEILPAVGNDGAPYRVIRRTASVTVKRSQRALTKNRPAKFYLGNGDRLLRTWDEDTFKTEDGELLVKLLR
jgi:hypothetical protein